jgi:hypothetical protein
MITMNSTEVNAARASLGPVGACLPVPFTGLPPAEVDLATGVGRLEHLAPDVLQVA